MTPSTAIVAYPKPTGHQRQPAWPRPGSATEIRSPMPHVGYKALNRDTHTSWDNPGCPTPQPSIEVSGITPVDWLDKDN